MIKKITHIPLFVDDQEKAKDFYIDKLGFELNTDADFNGDRWLTINPFEQKDVELSLMLAKTPEQKTLVGKQSGGIPIFCVETKDCIKTINELKKKGVTILEEPNQRPWGVQALISDLYGNIINIVQV